MADMMTFPETVEEFMEQYKITDTEQIYTNGAELVPIFRMMQWFEHLPSAQSETNFDEWCTDCKEYDQDKHCCHRFNKVIRGTVEEMKEAQPKTGKWITDNPSNPYESDYCKCSVCGYTNCTVEVFAFDGYKYCPNCGAKMLKEGE